MKILGWVFIGFLTLVAALGNPVARATHPTTPFKYWQDPCGYPPIPANYSPRISRLLEAEAILVPPSQIARRTDDPNFFRFTSTRPNVNWENTAIPMGGDAPFLGETQMAPNGRSGYLIAPNIIATAPHTTDFNPYAFVAVFDIRKMPQAGSNPVVCVPFDPEHIPAANVYYPRPTNALIINTILYYYGIYGAWTGVDYAAYYLERAAPASRGYLRIRKTGGISPEDHFAIASHPNRLGTKLLFGFDYVGQATNASYPSFTYPTFHEFYLWEGMSGAAVYNVDRNYVEIAVGAPTGQGCTDVLAPNTTLNPHNYYAVLDLCDDIPNPESHVPFPFFNDGPITALADLVPTPYLRVSPLADVDYVLPTNGIPTPSQTTYTAAASSSETAATAVSAYIATPPSGEPALLQMGGYNSSLAPGVSTTITVTASVPTATPCGVYDRYVTIADITHNFGDNMRHRFEIGMTDFKVTPDTSADIYAISGPSWPESLAYTLTNTRPTAVSIAVLFDKPWLALSPGSPAFVDLAPAGQNGSTKNVTVTLTSAVSSLRTGDYPFTISFAGQGSCLLNAPIQRAGVFHKGYLLMKKTLDALVFPPTPTNAPITDTFAPNSTFCVNDVKVRFNSERAGTAAGLHWSDWAPSVRIYLDRVGAETTSSQLWNLNPLPAGWTVPTYDGPDSTSIETLLLDRSQHVPPVGIAGLDAFNGKSAAGQWTFRLFDDGIQTINTGILESWELELRGSSSCLGSGG